MFQVLFRDPEPFCQCGSLGPVLSACFLMVLMKLVVCSRSSLETQSLSASVVPWGQCCVRASDGTEEVGCLFQVLFRDPEPFCQCGSLGPVLCACFLMVLRKLVVCSRSSLETQSRFLLAWFLTHLALILFGIFDRNSSPFSSSAFQDCPQMSSLLVLMKLVVCSRSSVETQTFSARVVPWGQCCVRDSLYRVQDC